MYKGSLVDIWSAGCILYVMLTGAHPFESDDENEIRSQILNDGLRFPDYLSAGSKALLKKILVIHPDTRASIHVIKNDPWFRVFVFFPFFFSPSNKILTISSKRAVDLNKKERLLLSVIISSPLKTLLKDQSKLLKINPSK